jgi:hypothetical protein
MSGASAAPTSSALPDNDPWLDSVPEPEPATLHQRLRLTRERQYSKLWDDGKRRPGGDARDRCVMHRAIGNLRADEADAKDKLLLHALESHMDGNRRQSCTASLTALASSTGLTDKNIQSRLAGLISRGRVEKVEHASGREGYRVVASHDERKQADTELRQLWKRVPEYSGWLGEQELPARFDEELRLLWTRELWRSSLPSYAKAVGIEVAQWVDRTGDAPFRRLTNAMLVARTGYSQRRVIDSISVLRQGRWIHVTSHWGRGDRGAGIEVRLRLANVEAVFKKYRAAVTEIPDELALPGLVPAPILPTSANPAPIELHTKNLQPVAIPLPDISTPSSDIHNEYRTDLVFNSLMLLEEGQAESVDEMTTTCEFLVCNSTQSEPSSHEDAGRSQQARSSLLDR